MTDDTRKLIERAGEWLDAPDDGSSMAASVLIEEMKAVLEAVLPTEDDREKLEYIFASEFKASKVMAMLMANAVQGAGFRRSPVPPETDAGIPWASTQGSGVYIHGPLGEAMKGPQPTTGSTVAAVPPVTEEPEWEYAVGTYDEDSGELIVDDMPTYYYPPTERAELDEGWFIVRKPVVPQQEWEVAP